jgi:hypothetical protein
MEDEGGAEWRLRGGWAGRWAHEKGGDTTKTKLGVMGQELSRRTEGGGAAKMKL